MHVPDGFLDAPTSVATGVVAVAAIGVSLAKARNELDDKTAPMAGLVAAFIFAVQMLNFPVASGTSGHLMGGALAAVLVGPWTAVLCMSVVFLVQCLLFADGGITALGTNITLMGLTTVLVGWLVFKGLQLVMPKRLSLVPVQAGIGAFVSVPVASLMFVVLYAVGGVAHIPLGNLATAMVGVHVLIGIGEGVITFLAVGAIIAVRPDLVYGARPVMERRELEIRPSSTGVSA
jgi:cobalt/nickel transport system permease protein